MPSIYGSRNCGRGPSQRPQGARPKSRKASSKTESTVKIDDTSDNASLKPNGPPPRKARALPAIPPTSARANTLCLPQSACGKRSLPLCPAAPSLNPQHCPFSSSSSLSSLSSSSFINPPSSTLSTPPSSTFSTPSSSTFSTPLSSTHPTPSGSTLSLATPQAPTLPIVVSTEYNHSSFVMEPIKFKYPLKDDSDCTSEDDEDADSDIMGPYKNFEYKQSTDHIWMSITQQNSSANRKWVKEKKGQRITVENYDKVLDILRTL